MLRLIFYGKRFHGKCATSLSHLCSRKDKADWRDDSKPDIFLRDRSLRSNANLAKGRLAAYAETSAFLHVAYLYFIETWWACFSYFVSYSGRVSRGRLLVIGIVFSWNDEGESLKLSPEYCVNFMFFKAQTTKR